MHDGFFKFCCGSDIGHFWELDGTGGPGDPSKRWGASPPTLLISSPTPRVGWEGEVLWAASQAKSLQPGRAASSPLDLHPSGGTLLIMAKAEWPENNFDLTFYREREREKEGERERARERERERNIVTHIGLLRGSDTKKQTSI